MKSDPDVIVVGGGPCGTLAALSLAKHGHNVTVFEEHSEIGFPCHCPGHLSINGLKNLGLYPLPAEVVQNSFRGAGFTSPSGRRFEVSFTSPVTCTVNRGSFDKYIAKLAANAGAHFYTNSQVKSLIMRKRCAKGVIVRQEERTVEATAKLIVDAEGVSSRILRQTGLTTCRRDWIVNGVSAEVDEVEGFESDKVEIFLGRDYALDFYAWFIPTCDAQAKVGLATKRGNPDLLLKRLIKKHPTASKLLHKARILEKTFHPITLGGPIPRAFSEGFVAVGDAASQAKPTTGGGIVMGLSCARLAARTAHEALCNNDFSARSLGTYQSLCERAFGFDVKAMLRIRRTLDALSDRQIDAALCFCQKFGLEKTMQEVADIDHQGLSLLRILRRPRTMAALGYLFYLYLAANP